MAYQNHDYSVVDESALRDAKHVPTCDVVEKLFPGHKVKRRGVFRSPFRNDRNPSFSPYLGHGGDWLWKDHATGESGDNLTLYRKVYPELSYQEAVDGLCRLVLGRTGLMEGGRQAAVQPKAAPRRKAVGPVKVEEQQLAQNVLYACRMDDERVPAEFRDYWRSRGISDRVILQYCEFVCFENLNRKGTKKLDPESGLPLMDKENRVIMDDGRRFGIGLKNDIGGYAIRVPDMPGVKGFKTNTTNFPATILADGSRPRRAVCLSGTGDNVIRELRYDKDAGRMWISGSQFFEGLRPDVAYYAFPFLSEFKDEVLYERELLGVCSVLDALSSPVSRRGAAVEGMFDGLSQRELSWMHHRRTGGDDLVVLNSVGNVRWAAPFLARHEQVLLMLDNDVRSGAGQNAYMKLCDEIARYNGIYGNRSVIFNGASVYAGYKDLNDALKASKGFSVRKIEPRKGNSPSR